MMTCVRRSTRRMQSGSSLPTSVLKAMLVTRFATVPLPPLSGRHCSMVSVHLSRPHPRRPMQTSRMLAVLSLQVTLPRSSTTPPPLPAGLGLCPPLQCGANRSITLVGVRADWEASLARFSPFMPTASPAATTSEQQRTSSPSQRRLRSECERLPANTSEADDASHQSDDEAEPVPTPLSDIAFEGAHIVEFTELTASNSRIQLENFVEQFRGVGLAPLIRYKLTSLAVQSCQYNSLSKPLVQVSGSTF